MKISCYGETYDVTMKKDRYSNNGNLAIKLTCEDGEPFATLTVNLNTKLDEDLAYVDTNNVPNAEQFIKENDLGEFTGVYGFSGFCQYPLYRFK